MIDIKQIQADLANGTLICRSTIVEIVDTLVALQSPTPVIDLLELSYNAIHQTYIETYGEQDPNVTGNDVDWHIKEIIRNSTRAAVSEPVCTECQGKCGFTESGCGEGCCAVGVMCEACCGTGLHRVQVEMRRLVMDLALAEAALIKNGFEKMDSIWVAQSRPSADEAFTSLTAGSPRVEESRSAKEWFNAGYKAGRGVE